MWILDFDKARPFDIDDEDIITKLKRGVCGNDPYFPHPRRRTELFNEFSQIYLKISEIILKSRFAGVERSKGQRILNLPRRFIDSWEEWGNEEEFEIMFGDEGEEEPEKNLWAGAASEGSDSEDEIERSDPEDEK